MLLLMMVRGADWVERAAEVISGEDFDDPQHRAIFQALLDDPEMRSPPTSMDPVAAQRLESMLSDSQEIGHGIEVFADSVKRIRVSALDRRIRALQERAEAATTEQEKSMLTVEMHELAQERRELDPPIGRPRHAELEA